MARTFDSRENKLSYPINAECSSLFKSSATRANASPVVTSTVFAAARAKLLAFSISVSNPSTSTSTLLSSATSVVISRGNPYVSYNKNASAPVTPFLSFFALAMISANKFSPLASVFLKPNSSRSNSAYIFSLRFITLGSHSVDNSMATFAIAEVNVFESPSSFMPNNLPLRTTRRINRLTMYPLPTFDGNTPSEIKYVTALM